MQYICVKGRGRARDLILDNPVMHARSLFGFVLLTYTLFTWPLAECEALSDDRESAMAIANNLQLGKIVLGPEPKNSLEPKNPRKHAHEDPSSTSVTHLLGLREETMVAETYASKGPFDCAHVMGDVTGSCNSLLQCLSHSAPFVNFCILLFKSRDIETVQTDFHLSKSMAQVMQSVSVSVRTDKDKAGERGDVGQLAFVDMELEPRSEDAHMDPQAIMWLLQQKTHGPTPSPLMSAIFGVDLCNTVRCTFCGCESNTSETR
jgi:hypothetical protein